MAQPSTRAEILDAATKAVLNDRQATHGRPENTFKVIAQLWTTYLGTPVSDADVAALLALLKIGRLRSNPSHADNWVDLAGYAACGGELAAANLLRAQGNESS